MKYRTRKKVRSETNDIKIRCGRIKQ